ncbi:cytosolic protein [Bacillus mangrovi]|uniref:Cytosolic protein n=1 Tax=Metabacillus mangrovi TaxID=1491830 RepID=A0A7X2V6I0_9BACI|nr:cytosolic protein [Metabacillus mangrovi]MTH55214.1 cytosolic protein [Metabacillus mangrovi]
METFTVGFHQEDQMHNMTVQLLSEEDFQQHTEGGTRHLFELDTNVGFFVFFDAVDEKGKESYLVLRYEENEEDPSACYGFELRDFYQFTALYLNDLEFSEEVETAGEEEEVYGPVHHLAHLMHHIVEEGKKLE